MVKRLCGRWGTVCPPHCLPCRPVSHLHFRSSSAMCPQARCVASGQAPGGPHAGAVGQLRPAAACSTVPPTRRHGAISPGPAVSRGRSFVPHTSRPQGAVTARGVTEYAFGSGLYPFWSGPLISHKIPRVNRVPWVGGRCAGPCGPTYRPWCSQTQLSEKEPALHLHTCLVSCLPLSQSSAPHLTPPSVLQRSYLSVSCLSVKRDYLGTLQNKRKQTTLFKSF